MMAAPEKLRMALANASAVDLALRTCRDAGPRADNLDAPGRDEGEGGGIERVLLRQHPRAQSFRRVVVAHLDGAPAR